MRLLVVCIVFLFMASQAEAQLFRRVDRSVHQSYGGHWSYPGDIATHMAREHGQSVAGLSREQMLNLHDALHEGRTVAVQKQITVTQRVMVTQKPMPVDRPKKQPELVIIQW